MANTNFPFPRKRHSRVQRTQGSPLSIHQLSASRQGSIVSQAQVFWTRWVKDTFSYLNSRAYFLPPVYVNRVHVTREATLGQEVLVLRSAPSHPGQMQQPTATASSASQVLSLFLRVTDIGDDAAMQRVFMCLQKLGDNNAEVMVGISQLQFGQYLGEPCYAQLPRPTNLPPKLEKGDFDVLLIHQHYGFVVCEVKAFGDSIQQLNMRQPDIDNVIRQKLKQSVSQLDKAEAVLSHPVSDISPSLRITKTIAVPNLTARQVQQDILSDPKLTQDLCRCLGTTDPADITGFCLCSDQLSDPKTPWDVSSDVLRELENVWLELGLTVT